MTVARLLTEIDSAELTEWLAFFELQKEGPDAGMNLEQKLKNVFGAPHERR